MKPISVKFQCFGPYMQEQYVDFQELEKNGLFLISGETGAGKTTILDAICYALYGESSGGQRGDLESMRCKLAEKGEETALEFIFDSSGKRYKFSRSLKYKTKKLHDYHTCYVWDGEEYQVLASGKTQVNAQAQRLVGLTSSQFRQVIILPQGKFEEFLVSDSQKKEEILVTLFHVGQWKKISDEISRRVTRRGEVLSGEKTAMAELLRRYGCASLEELGAKRAALEGELETAKAQAAQAAQALAEAENAHSAAKLDGEAFAQLARLREKYAALEEKTRDMTREAEFLARADRADTLRPALDAHRSAAAAKNQAQGEEALARHRLTAAQDQAAQAEQAQQRHQARQPEMEENQRRKLLLEQSWEVYSSLAQLETTWQTAQQQHKTAQQSLNAREADLQTRDHALTAAFAAQDQARDAYEIAREHYRRSIGGILAESLEAGKPCPVCGSLTHPAPAQKGEAHVSESQLDKLNKALGQSGKAVSAAMKARSQAEQARDQARTAFDAAAQTLTQAQSALELARQRKLPGIETLAQLNREVEGLEEALSGYGREGQQLLTARTGAEGVCQAARLALEAAREKLTAAQSAWTVQEINWAAALEAGDFATEQEFLACCLEPERKQSRYRRLLSWRADLQTAQNALREQQSLLAGKTAPDMLGLQAALEDAGKRHKALSDKALLDGKTLKDMTADEKALTTRQERYQEAMAKLEADQVFARRLAGSHGVGLQRYVLGVMMNSITAQANRLLETVYGGRYRLYRTDETTGRTLKGGLELEVFDSHNSQRRSVRTLSGGEKFLVALSLAIGLSTVVQAQGEGIRLEAMFIDEGFGSLDREAIEDALQILQGIQRTAGVVGIISHVETLAETIPARLEITKGKQGSQCRLVL